MAITLSCKLQTNGKSVPTPLTIVQKKLKPNHLFASILSDHLSNLTLLSKKTKRESTFDAPVLSLKQPFLLPSLIFPAHSSPLTFPGLSLITPFTPFLPPRLSPISSKPLTLP